MREKIISIVGEGNFFENESMAKHTSFRAGGNAKYYITPTTAEELMEVIKVLKKEEVEYLVIGNGSNLLIKDTGYLGAIIKIGSNFSDIKVYKKQDEFILNAAAGATLGKTARIAYDNSLTGFEELAGIPGTIGGSVFMNAGAYGKEIKDVIYKAVVMDKYGTIMEIDKEGLDLSYRHSIIAEKEYIVLSASFLLKRGDRTEIFNGMEDFAKRRLDKQPLELPSAGSTFKRPEGFFAGKLIMDAGLSGYKIGDAMVSEKHCGFVVNTGSASADDIMKLIAHVKKTVYDKFEVELEEEVKIIG
jgi:UDP-N-acetylmuramate dehydrogenase